MRGDERSFIRISGGIITSHFVTLLQDEDHGFEYARPETFVRPWHEEDAPPQDDAHFLAQVRDVWEHLLRRFDEKFRDIRVGRMNAEDVRRLWQRPVLDALGFELTSTSKQIVISDRLKYIFSHRGWFPKAGIPKPPVIHILPVGTDPDARPSRGEPSPHDALQDCLNRHDDIWAVLMNETVIRILRDYHHTTVPGYIEFDLEGIFLNRSFPEFLALYRFCHVSRFARNAETGKEPLEEYYEVSRQAGEKIGENLRENVVRAIEELGNGFLDTGLIERLRGNNEACRVYYQEILTVVYRIIFMLFAEQRGMLGIGEHGDLFLEEYSITSLRERVDAFVGRDDRHTDLWEGLSVTFGMLEKGVPILGVNAFDGLLFSHENECYLKDAKCRNTALMNAIRALTWTVPITESRGRRQQIHGRQRISYADLSVEEIGAIYEGLLAYIPRITVGFEPVNDRECRPGEFVLDPRGSERKTTGSYYTNPDLIAELISSALDPVITHRLSQAGMDRAAREKALLSIRVCDPACGSGAFLIAVSNRLGHELAKVRAKTELPSSKEVQAARRDVLSHCIYGVDLNPMAVELAKVSLWLNALVADKPLSFLDHHIRCGNSLIGATPEMIASGIPDGAYTAVEGDISDVANAVKKANRDQRVNQTFAQFSGQPGLAEACAERFAALADVSEDDPVAVETKKAKYESLLASAEYAKEHLTADCWCAAFFWPLTKDHGKTIPTTETIRKVQVHGNEVLDPDIRAEVQAIAEKHRFFHWHLEFPEVFADGGFDCVLGNPPWERIKIQEKEFFSFRDRIIAAAKNASERNRLILKLKEQNVPLHNEFQSIKRASERESLFLRTSGRFPLTGKGDINTYTVFTELFFRVISANGYAGIIIPPGIIFDDTSKDFFAELMRGKNLVSFKGFVNEKFLFRAVEHNIRFCLFTISGKNHPVTSTEFVHDCEDTSELFSKNRVFSLNIKDIELLNPNTHTAPVFRTKNDAELVKTIYRKFPILINERNDINLWSLKFLRMIDMSNDSGLFITTPHSDYVPLYESKMIHQYDHRFGSFENLTERTYKLPETTELAHQNPNYTILPYYWIKKDIVEERNPSIRYRNWFLAFRNNARKGDERTGIFTILPNVGAGNSIPVFIFSEEITSLKIACLLGCFNSIIFDYILRQKLGGPNLNFFIIKQIPVLPPETFSDNVLKQIVPRVLELVYTSHDIKAFADDIWIDSTEEIREFIKKQWAENQKNANNTLSDTTNMGPTPQMGIPLQPFVWDLERRHKLCSELDAYYAILYEITRDELRHILDPNEIYGEDFDGETFRVLKNREVSEFGHFKTRDLVIQSYDEISKDFIRIMRADLPRKNGEIDWKAVISRGENERIEFKESMSWDVRLKMKNKALEHTIARTIASFMNTHGGVLFIGVNDAGNIVWLDGDIKISKGQNEDGLRLRFDDLVKHYLGNQFLPLIKVHSLEEAGKLYWALEVKATDQPVYVNQNGEEEFWIRGTSSSRKLSLRESIEFIKGHFKSAS